MKSLTPISIWIWIWISIFPHLSFWHFSLDFSCICQTSHSRNSCSQSSFDGMDNRILYPDYSNESFSSDHPGSSFCRNALPSTIQNRTFGPAVYSLRCFIWLNHPQTSSWHCCNRQSSFLCCVLNLFIPLWHICRIFFFRMSVRSRVSTQTTLSGVSSPLPQFSPLIFISTPLLSYFEWQKKPSQHLGNEPCSLSHLARIHLVQGWQSNF